MSEWVWVIYSWIQSSIFTSFAQQIRRPLCVHHDLLLAARICLHLFQRLACIMERPVVVIWFLWGRKWIVAFRCGTFLCVLIIIFKYCDWRRTDVGPTSSGDINPTSKQRQTSTPAFLALCEGNPSGTDGFPSRKVRNAASVGPMLVQRWHTTIGVTLCHHWPNVSVPTLARHHWANVGPIDKSTLEPTLVSRRWPNVRVYVGPTLGQRLNASWDRFSNVASDWQMTVVLYCHPIKSRTWKFFFTNMDFKIEIFYQSRPKVLNFLQKLCKQVYGQVFNG